MLGETLSTSDNSHNTWLSFETLYCHAGEIESPGIVPKLVSVLDQAS